MTSILRRATKSDTETPDSAVIDALREQRPYMVERDDQALMLYEALVAVFASASDANAKDGA